LPATGNRISTPLSIVSRILTSWKTADLILSTEVLLPFLQDQLSVLLSKRCLRRGQALRSVQEVPTPGSGLGGAYAGVRPCARCKRCLRRGQALRSVQEVPTPGSGLALGVVVGQVRESEIVPGPGPFTDRQSLWLAVCTSLTGTDSVSNLVHRAEQQSTESTIWRKRDKRN